MIGSYEPYNGDQYNKTNVSYFETFDIQTEEWFNLKRNPFIGMWAQSYWEGTSVTKEDSFLVFGGEVREGGFKDDYMPFVLEYKSDIWERLGTGCQIFNM